MEWVWQWWESEAWHRLDLACQTVLPLLPEKGGCLEIRTPEHVIAVTDTSAAVATYRAHTETDPTLREDYADFATDLNDMVQKLFTVAASPPLPRG